MADGAAVCVCILFYGAGEKYLKLAQRVLNGPMRDLATQNVEFRFGCNAVGESTDAFLRDQIDKHFHRAIVFEQPVNLFKYPMMRRMVHSLPVTAPTTMWFDHDSYLDRDIDSPLWLTRILRQLNGCDMIGSVHKGLLSEKQVDWITKQSWKTSDAPPRLATYASGSWWAANTSVLQKYDWPPADLGQKGGDMLFGELFKQQHLSLCHFRDGVRINVNDAGVEGACPRTIV